MHFFKPSVLLLLITIGSATLKAQDSLPVPENINMRTDKDFENAEPFVLESANWLIQTDLDKNIQDRKKVNEFVWKWISGTPAFTLDITDNLTKLYENNIQLLNIFLAVYASNYIRHKTEFSNLSASRDGIEAMIQIYKKGIDIKKNKEMEKISHMPKADLETYISIKFN